MLCSWCAVVRFRCARRVPGMSCPEPRCACGSELRARESSRPATSLPRLPPRDRYHGEFFGSEFKLPGQAHKSIHDDRYH